MSGHSKWAKIKRQKGVNDLKRGNLFTKLAKNISLAAKEGGGDINMNFALRLAVDKAKVANMPSDNIQRAIDKGTGNNSEGSTYTRISYEALGPGGIAVIIDCQTDNTNRTVSEVRNIVETAGGKLATTGSISWQFTEKGLIVIAMQKVFPGEKFGKGDEVVNIEAEESESEILDIDGVEDFSGVDWETETGEIKALEIITAKEAFSKVLKAIEGLKYKVLSAELVKVPNEKIDLNDEKILEKISDFIQLLEEHDDVDSVWINN